MNMTSIAIATTLLTVAAASLTPAQAATIYDNQKITQVAVGDAYNGDVVIQLSGNSGMSKPACATDNTWSLRFDGTTDAGKQAYSMAMLAQSAGATVAVSGEAFCIGTIQKLRWIRLK